MPEEVASVLIAEDQDITRLGLRLTLEKISGVRVVGEAADGESVVKQAKELRPAIILMDIDLPGVDGIAATKTIKEALPKTGIIMFTSDSSDQSIFAALSAGADGYCLKNISADRLGTAINSVMQGAAWLDPGIARRVLTANAKTQSRSQDTVSTQDMTTAKAPLNENQVAILHLIEKGESLEQIALTMKVTPEAVESKVRDILGSFLASYAAKTTLIHPNEHNPGEAQTADHSTRSSPSPPTALVEITPGTVLGERYVIEEAVGSGGMSTVYRARHKLIERIVAIKMLHQRHLTKELQVKRFYQEAKAASFLSHPNIVTTFDFGVTPEGLPFLVMDYIDGVSLQDLIVGQKLNLQRCIGIFLQVCDALTHAHRKGIIHRDLKPSNMMLLKADDDADLVKLVDFGIAKFLVESELDAHLTRPGDLFGTPFYMSPEQCRGQPMDARSDLYSFGCVMYEALAGEPPFRGATAFETLNSHVNETPSRLPFVRPGKTIPRELETLLFRTLSKEPILRPQSAAELKRDLVRIQSSLPQSQTHS